MFALRLASRQAAAPLRRSFAVSGGKMIIPSDDDAYTVRLCWQRHRASFSLTRLTKPLTPQRPLSATCSQSAVSKVPADQVILTYYTATWCGPCRAVSPVVDDLSEEYDGKAVFFKVRRRS